VTSSTPPARGEKSAASFGLDVSEVGDAWVFWVGAESVLLTVACTEDVVTCELNSDNSRDPDVAKLDRVDGKVACLNAVDERNPNQVAE